MSLNFMMRRAYLGKTNLTNLFYQACWEVGAFSHSVLFYLYFIPDGGKMERPQHELGEKIYESAVSIYCVLFIFYSILVNYHNGMIFSKIYTFMFFVTLSQ
jgi:hypothetical protein